MKLEDGLRKNVIMQKVLRENIEIGTSYSLEEFRNSFPYVCQEITEDGNVLVLRDYNMTAYRFLIQDKGKSGKYLGKLKMEEL